MSIGWILNCTEQERSTSSKGKPISSKIKIDRLKGETDRFKGENDQWKQAERLGDRAKSSVESFGLSRQGEQDVPAKSDRSGG